LRAPLVSIPGKNTLHDIGLDEKGALVLREKVSRTRIVARFVNVPPCLIGIEAGMASHHIARELVALGHEVKQVPPTYSRPFRQGHKNDFRNDTQLRKLSNALRRGAFG
jgi:transposase